MAAHSLAFTGGVLRAGEGDRPPLVLSPMTEAAAEALGPVFATIDPWRSYPFSAQSLTGYLKANEEGAPRFLVEVNGEPAAVMGLRLNWLRGPYVQFLGVRPDYQSTGIGTALLTFLETVARKFGERNLWIASAEFNAKAIAFYERFGFIAAARLPDLVCDGRTEILLRKRLS